MVINVSPFSALRDNLMSSQYSKVLRNGRRSEFDFLLNLADPQLTSPEFFQDSYSIRIGEHSQELCQFSGRYFSVRHVEISFIMDFIYTDVFIIEQIEIYGLAYLSSNISGYSLKGSQSFQI